MSRENVVCSVQYFKSKFKHKCPQIHKIVECIMHSNVWPSPVVDIKNDVNGNESASFSPVECVCIQQSGRLPSLNSFSASSAFFRASEPSCFCYCSGRLLSKRYRNINRQHSMLQHALIEGYYLVQCLHHKRNTTTKIIC